MTSGSTSGREPDATPARDRRGPELLLGLARGARHLREDKPCQDAIRGVREGDVVVLAVADGHGTSAHGDVGAELAVDVAVRQLLHFAIEVGAASDLRAVLAFAEYPLRVHIVREWADRVRRHAAVEDADLQPYGSTLLFALAAPWFLLVGQLGDGDILLIDASRQVARPINPDPRNFADETTSLCQDEAWKAMRVHAMPAPRAEALLLLSTDGYSKSYATDEDFELIGPDYLGMFHENSPDAVERQLPDILNAVSSGGSGDDIALGIVHWPRMFEAHTSPNEDAPTENAAAHNAHKTDTAGAGDVAPSSPVGIPDKGD